MSYEAARILHHLGCHVQVYNPSGLPLKDDCPDSHPKVQELRQLMDGATLISGVPPSSTGEFVDR
jgi:hypothetical protein